ncbi:MAG: hypothetical protein E7294_15280 [Lachnospiraceae bacterium]|nr:hypothetical protein [Lachnospiraceae bacterium]
MPKELTMKDKLYRHGLAKTVTILMMIAVLVAAVAMIRIYIEGKHYSQFEVVDTFNKVGAETSSFRDYQGNLLVYSNDGVSAYNTKGKQLWNKTYEMQSPIVKVKGNYVACADYKGGRIYVMDENGPACEIETNMPVIDLNLSEKGVVAATLQEDKITWIKVYSSEGVEISEIKTTMEKSGYPIATAISADNVKLGVSCLKPQGSGVSTSVAFYNFGDVGQNETDHLVSGKDFEGSMIPFLEYAGNDNAIAISEDRFMIYKGKEKPALEEEIELKEEVKSVFYSENYVALVFNNTESEQAYRMDLYDMSGKQMFSYVFDMEYHNVLIRNDYVLVYNEEEVIILDKKGKEKYNGNMGGNIVSIVPTETKWKFLIVRSDEIEVIKLY